jgi:dihydroorotate dehydrogenase electron transfer subunit
MPVDVAAEVASNTRLTAEYNVVALVAPAIAAAVLPGQFVMVKAARGCDPLLRRPFSVFQIVRDSAGTPTGVTLLNKRVGVGTGQLYALRPGDRVDCLGPLGRPFAVVDPPAEAWMVAGGVGLAPFATLAEALAARGTPTTLFYGGRRATDLFYVHWFERLGVRVMATTEDGSGGERGLVTAPLARALAGRAPGSAVALYACGPTPMMRAVHRLAGQARVGLQVSLEPTMGCGLGGCYSCVVAVRENGRSHFVRSCLEGPVFDASRLVWESLERSGG